MELCLSGEFSMIVMQRICSKYNEMQMISILNRFVEKRQKK